MCVCALGQTSALTQGLERIPGQLGYLVISEDGVLAVSLFYAHFSTLELH